MNIKTAIRRIKKHRPKTYEDFAEAGVPLEIESLGEGVFRVVYRAHKLPLVVKFPLAGDGDDHTRSEVRRIKALSKYPKMRKYLPKVYYYDSRAGIVVMKYYPPMDKGFCECGCGTATSLERLAQNLVKDLTGMFLDDIHAGNVTTDTGQSNGRPIFLDLGY